jgi:hypothetical protein
MPAAGAEVVLGRRDVDALGRGRGAEHLQALGDDLGTDPVTSDDGQGEGGRGRVGAAVRHGVEGMPGQARAPGCLVW